MPSRKLLEQCQKLDKTWSHIFTTIFSLDEGTNEAIWYAKVTELIEKQQTSPIWMSESKVFILRYIEYADKHRGKDEMRNQLIE